jgi:hypothetical protein
MPGSPIRRKRRQEAARAAKEAQMQLSARTEYPSELKAAILDDAIDALSCGQTAKHIALRHQIPVPTLTSWLIADKRCEDARADFISGKLADALDLQENGKDQLEVVRGERLFRSWSWIAERRLPTMFMPPKDKGPQETVRIVIGISRREQEAMDLTPPLDAQPDAPTH